MRLSIKLLGQGHVKERLKSSPGKIYGRYDDLTKQYEVPSPECYTTFLRMTIYNGTLHWWDITPIFDPLLIWTLLPNFTFYLIMWGFHRTFATWRHANRGRLLLRTPGPVPYGICKCYFVETIDTQSYITPVYVTFPWLECLPNLTLLLNIGFHRASATGVACRQGTVTPPDTWSCPTLGLAYVLMSRPISPDLVLFPDFFSLELPSLLLFCLACVCILHLSCYLPLSRK